MRYEPIKSDLPPRQREPTPRSARWLLCAKKQTRKRTWMVRLSRLTETEIAELHRRRPGVRASFECENMRLTADEEALFEQFDREGLTMQQREGRLIAWSRGRMMSFRPDPAHVGWHASPRNRGPADAPSRQTGAQERLDISNRYRTC